MPNVIVYQSEQLLRSVGAERIDEKASELLAERLEDHAEDILFNAMRLAQLRGRKRLKQEDIELAAEML